MNQKTKRNLTLQRELKSQYSNGKKLNNQHYLIADTKSYIVTADCLLEHIITTDNLNNYEKLYYLLADSLSTINKKRGGSRSCALASTGWGKNLNCSKSLVFNTQRTLEEKGYFVLEKSFTERGLKKRNIISPTIPKDIFDYLNEKYADRTNEQHLPYNSLKESRRDYLERTKLFIRINYHLLKQIISSDLLNNQQKIMWLGFYSKSYKNYNSNNSFSLIASYQELQSFYSCSYQKISKSIIGLSKLGFIKTNNFYLKENIKKMKINYIDNPTLSARKDKSLWKISLCLPESYILKIVSNKRNGSSISTRKETTEEALDRKTENNLESNEDYEANSKQKDILTSLPIDNELDDKKTDKSNNTSCLETDTLSKSSTNTLSKSEPHINKDLKIKNYISNLYEKPKVIFKGFIKKLATKSNSSLNKAKPKKVKPFSFIIELIKEKLKLLPKDKADKARKFAYKLAGNKLACGYAATLSAKELAQELIYHAATWKPSRLGKLSRDKEIDTALTVAWRAIIKGTWQSPFNYMKTFVLDYEFEHYRDKYKLSGAISPSIKILALEAEKLIGKWYDLEAIIKSEVKLDEDDQKENDSTNLLSLSFDVKNPDQEIKHLLKPEENADQQNNLSSIDLSNLSEEKKYLVLSGTDTEMMEIVTTDNRQFYAKLKSMEMNDNGELVVTLTPKNKQQFLDNIIVPKLKL